MTLPFGAKLLRRLSKKTSSRLNLIERNIIQKNWKILILKGDTVIIDGHDQAFSKYSK